jgi:hypothetical protein
MIFSEYMEELQVWRMISPVGALADPAWTLQCTISGRVEPVVGTEEFLNNQSFASITEVLFFPLEYRSRVQAGDGIVDIDGRQHKVIGRPEIWKSMLPHVACKLSPVQWDMTV